MQKGIIISYIVFISFIVLVFIAVAWNKYTPSILDDFSKCIAEENVKFYGAFWCPYCQEQKHLFGKSEKFIPYIECSNPDRKTQTNICIEEKIQTYPTWKFDDGKVCTSVIQLDILAKITGCELPDEKLEGVIEEYAFYKSDNGENIVIDGKEDEIAKSVFIKALKANEVEPESNINYYFFLNTKTNISSLCYSNEQEK